VMSPHVVSGRTYFALVVIDRSAAAVEQVLTACAAAPFLTALRMRFLGVASIDDRGAGDRGAARGPGPFPDIVISPSGAWRRENDLVDVLRRHGDELLRYFATRKEPGLGLDELTALQARYEQHSASESETGTPASASEAAARKAKPDQDLLVTGAGAPPGRPTPAEARLGEQDPGEQQARTGIRSRWLPQVRWRRGQQEPADGDAVSGGPATRALVYLLITGDDTSVDHAAWNRSRAALLAVDRSIAETPGVAGQVRALQGDEDALRGELREAGRLTRREVKRPVADADFAAVLEGIRALLRRDRSLAEAPDVVAIRAAVVFFAPNPPLADTVAADVFAELAREALVTWVLPRESAGLLAPAFRETAGVRVLTDYEAVAGEVMAQLSGEADVTEATAEPRLPAITPRRPILCGVH
jgi:hypothetical protein